MSTYTMKNVPDDVRKVVKYLSVEFDMNGQQVYFLALQILLEVFLTDPNLVLGIIPTVVGGRQDLSSLLADLVRRNITTDSEKEID